MCSSRQRILQSDRATGSQGVERSPVVKLEILIIFSRTFACHVPKTESRGFIELEQTRDMGEEGEQTARM